MGAATDFYDLWVVFNPIRDEAERARRLKAAAFVKAYSDFLEKDSFVAPVNQVFLNEKID